MGLIKGFDNTYNWIIKYRHKTNRMKKYKIKIFTLNGLKQKPIDTDFHIMPCLTYAYESNPENLKYGNAYGLGIEWGFWAVVIGLFIVKID